MERARPDPVVHLELRTANLARACAFYARMFGWSARTVRLGANSYVTLELGGRASGGVAEDEREQSIWLPYVEVDCVAAATERAAALGAAVTLGPREGPAGWRSVIAIPDGAEVGLWRAKS